MYARMNMLAGDPGRLNEGARYLEGTVRPHVEAQPGNRGLAFLTNADLGLGVIASYWDSADAMTASEQAVQVSRKELAELMQGTVTVEHYEVPVPAPARPSAAAPQRTGQRPAESPRHLQRSWPLTSQPRALDGTDHATHHDQGSMIRRYIIWRNNHAYDQRLLRIVDRANVA